MEGFFKKIKDETDKKFGVGAANNNNNPSNNKKESGGSSWTGGNNLNDANKNNKPTPKPLAASRKNPFENAKNPFASLGKSKKFQGGGQSLGGAKPGKVIHVVIEDPGPLGIKVEKRSKYQQTAIVSMVVPGGQGDAAKLKRGDIVCHPGSDGQEEIMYDQFLAMAASNQRPFIFDVRRVEGGGGGGGGGGPAEAAAARAGGTTTGGKNKSISSAEAYSRKQAVIAAAEARDRAHKAKTKPAPKKKNVDRLTSKGDNAAKVSNEEMSKEPMSEEARKAVEDSKAYEAQHAAQLGYNPYETARMGAGQARTATVAMTHGTMSAGEGGDTGTSQPASNAAGAPNTVAPPSNPVQPSDDSGKKGDDNIDAPINPAFDEAYTNIVLSSTSQSTILSSFSIMRKLIMNATTKGQSGDDATSSKFRRVRLSNPKIAAAITNVPGALDLMLSVGFVLSENAEDGETYLVFPPGDKGPEWLERALKRMEAYEKGGSSSGAS